MLLLGHPLGMTVTDIHGDPAAPDQELGDVRFSGVPAKRIVLQRETLIKHRAKSKTATGVFRTPAAVLTKAADPWGLPFAAIKGKRSSGSHGGRDYATRLNRVSAMHVIPPFHGTGFDVTSTRTFARGGDIIAMRQVLSRKTFRHCRAPFLPG